MQTSIKKFNSFSQLSKAINADKETPETWKMFLKEKGHTEETFNYLPESLKLALKLSFAKR